ncbi:MAG: glycoside hydrolase family 9 protein [Bacteroidota bacterium]
MFRFSVLFALAISWSITLFAQLGTPSHFIRVDQFGYLPNSSKVAVLADPQVGFDAADSFSPGTTYEVRRMADDAVVLTTTPQAWNGGATHQQSGDKGWWVDFSALTTPGSYYLYDVDNQVRSFEFEIGADVYEEVLKVAVRTYYYQRVNEDRQPPYVESKWSDGPAYDGAGQDREARSRWAKNDASTAKDVHGGWMDAGDPNKYTTFAEGCLMDLLGAYQMNPAVFTDDYEIPESGNGIPDLVDEVIFELEWLMRMQDATGTNGLLLKVGVDNYNGVSPYSLDTRPRYYVPECTSATLTGSGVFAMAAWVLKDLPELAGLVADLEQRAILAWERGRSQTQDFTTYELDCDDGDITSGDADRTAQDQLESAFIGAAYLFALTDSQVYQTFLDAQYANVRPYSENWWGPYRSQVVKALLTYATLPQATSSVANDIRNQKGSMDYLYSIDDKNQEKDLYRAFLEDWAFHWGSSNVRATAGNMNLYNLFYGINSDRHDQYREVAMEYLHYFHGVNALNIVMLSNMYQHGAENSINEIYHGWFDNGTEWDNALTSPKGPAPGYVVGGPNASFSVSTISPPANQPPHKAYKDWNTGWPENSWELSEPAIYYQAAYIALLSSLMEPTEDTVANSLFSPVQSLPINVWPQPAKTEIQVELPANVRGEVQVQWMDLMGRQVATTQTHRVEAGQVVVVPTPPVSDGVYALRIRQGDRWWGSKVQLQK